MIIAFRVLKASLRGTEVAIYDYALANEKVLRNTSIILIADQYDKEHHPLVIAKFRAQFNVYFYNPHEPVDSIGNIEDILSQNNCSILYTICYGERRINDGSLSINKVYKTAVHCVFSLADPYGDSYCAISATLAKKYNETIYVPHIVKFPLLSYTYKNLRDTLGIPKDAIVFGRHGGYDTFDIPFVHDAIENVLSQTEDIYFLFLNTKPFTNTDTNGRCIYLDPIVDSDEKTSFILACDAMIHGRQMGETFGIACGEFSILNKPVITCNCGDTAHIDILGEKCIIYTCQSELENILLNFTSIKEQKEERLLADGCNLGYMWNGYEDFSDEQVIRLWWKHLIEPLIKTTYT